MRKLSFMIILFLLLFPFDVFSLERSEENNFGVNKQWKIDQKNKGNVLNTPYVDVSDMIYDYADILSSDEEKDFKEKMAYLNETYKIDVVIYTVDKYIDADLNEEVATDFYDYNDFGIDRNKYDGILIYRNANKDKPYYGMYSFGNSQLYLSSLVVDDILDYVNSYMIHGNYDLAINYMFDAIDTSYKSGISYSMKNAYIDKNGFIKYKYKPNYLIDLIISVFSSVLIVAIMMSKNKMVKKPLMANSYLDLETINYITRTNEFVSSHTTTTSLSSTASSGGNSHGGGHSSTGSSGGGHSGGGRVG